MQGLDDRQTQPGKPMPQNRMWLWFYVLLVAFSGWSLLMLGRPYGVAGLKDLSGGVGPLDFTFYYTPDQAYQVMEQLGPAGRQAYGRFVLLDLVYIPIYMSFLVVGLNLFMRELGLVAGRIFTWRMLPVYAGIADFGEEASLIAILGNYPDRLDGVVEFMNLFSMAKMAMFSLSVLLLAYLIVHWLRQRGVSTSGEEAGEEPSE